MRSKAGMIYYEINERHQLDDLEQGAVFVEVDTTVWQVHSPGEYVTMLDGEVYDSAYVHLPVEVVYEPNGGRDGDFPVNQAQLEAHTLRDLVRDLERQARKARGEHRLAFH